MASTKLALFAVVLLQACWCVVSQQDAVMTWTRFDEEGGNGPAACDGEYHYDGAPIAALSTEWYADGSRCWKGIHITSKDTGKTVRVSVVDEVDGGNKIATTGYVWELLGFDYNQDWGEVAVTWADE
jgi:hypothetical protein